MRNNLPKILQSFFICLVAYIFPITHAYATPNLQLNPSDTSVVQNTTFQQKILINVDGNNALSSDAIVNYAGADLEVISVTSGGFFPEFSYANDASGKLEIHGYTTSGNATITGNGTLATITLKAKKASGSSTISFTCSGGTTNTNILTTSGQNILDCAQINQASITYTGQPAPTPTPTPGQISGNFIPVCASLSTSITQATGVPVAVTFTCSGTDTQGDITAAEFTFGDGTNNTIYKNVGSPGSLSTTQTYTTIGTFGTQCRVRDNDNVWSSVSDGCKKVITIKPKTATTSNQNIAVNLVPTPTPTPQIVAIVSETPTAAATQQPSPTPIKTQIASTGNNTLLWWSLGILAAGIAISVAFGKKK